MRSYFTRVSSGYITQGRPIAIESETVSIFSAPRSSDNPGTSCPSTMPSTVARKIQVGGAQSSVESRSAIRSVGWVVVHLASCAELPYPDVVTISPVTLQAIASVL